MIDWTKPIEDKTKDSRLWKARGKEGVHGGCYICGSTDHAKEYAFGRLHITTLERHITADSRLATTKQYSYATPVRRYLCDDCLRWEYQNRIVKRDFALFLFFFREIWGESLVVFIAVVGATVDEAYKLSRSAET
jgi:uncharacterized protein YlaI